MPLRTFASQRQRILVVEDEAPIAMEIELRLSKMGYEVIGPVATGEKALALAAQAPPDLTLMDIHLSGAMDGIQTAAMLRTQHQIPIVYLSAYSDDATLQRATTTSPSGYLTKPFSDRDLHAAIELALYKHATDCELRRYREQLEKTVEELRAALAEVKTLKSLLPVCASCKRIRDDAGYWSAVDTYVINEGLGEVTHGICPDCAQKLYPKLGLGKPLPGGSAIGEKPAPGGTG